MISRSDRRDVGILGLCVLGWGLVAAPLLHVAVGHSGSGASLGDAADLLGHGTSSVPTKASGHGHTHGVPVQGASHGAGAIEHGLALFETPVAFASTVLVLLVLPAAPARDVEAPALTARFSLEQPQGP